MLRGDVESSIFAEVLGRGHRLQDWLVWKVGLPLCFLLLIWPIYKLVLRLEHPFERAFAHGELLLFAALILIEAAVEGEGVLRQGLLFRLGRNGAKVIAYLTIFVFGFIKYDSMLQEERVALGGEPVIGAVEKLTDYAYFNLGAVIAAVLLSVIAFAVSVEKRAEERLRIVAGVVEESKR